MNQTVRLHGGPGHGEVTVVPDWMKHFHITSTVTPPDGAMEDTPVLTREGMYSRVRETNDFEWDGWLSHD